jgi:cytidine deaminase
MTHDDDVVVVNDDGSIEIPCAGCDEPLLFYTGDKTHICMVNNVAYPICKACYDNDDLDVESIIREGEENQ